MSRHDRVSISVLEGVVVWCLEARSNLVNSSSLISVESVQVSNVPLVSVDVSVVGSLGSVVRGSGD